MSSFSPNAFVANFIKGVSRAFLIFYIFCSPLMIEDEVRRIDPQFNIAKIFLPLLALIKLFFGLMHIILKANSKEITKLLLTMIFLSAIVSHSNLNQDITFKDIYLSHQNTNPIDTNKPTNNVFTFLYGYIPYLDNLISQIPNILDTKHLGVGMTANVASLSIHSTNLIAYHWLIIIGVVSSICCHMVVYKDYSRIGRIGLGLFYILYGVSIMLLNEFQRPFIHTLTNYNIINNSMDNSAIIRIILIISFICCACGISLITNVKYKKLGIFISIGYILILISYETECLLIGQKKRKMYGISDTNIDLKLMLKYHNKYIYPTDYQLLRIINLTMILSGNLFEMLKIYNPSKAESSQDDYSSVD
eukprot:181650_1